jgi:hypothetical protein
MEKEGTHMIFYNGFNLMVDIIVAVVSLIAGYKFGWWDGLKRGVEIADADESCSWKSWHPDLDMPEPTINDLIKSEEESKSE